MANPLINRRQSTSTEPQDHGRVDPVPEEYAGENFPYRGIETHGVEPTERPEEEREWDGVVPAEYRIPDAEPEPTPVRIVQTGGKELHKWHVRRDYANGAASRILGRNETRTAMRVRNLDPAVTVWVGSEGSVQAFTGYPVPAGTEFKLDKAEAEVWAISEDGTQVPLAIIEEYTVRQ